MLAPKHEKLFEVITGVYVTIDAIAFGVLLVATNEAILPDPLLGRPIFEFELSQLNVVAFPENIISGTVIPLHIVMSEVTFEVGVGKTEMLKAVVLPGQETPFNV